MRKTNSYVDTVTHTQNEPSNGHYFRRLSGTTTNNNYLANDPRYTIVELGPPKNKVCFDETAEEIGADSDDTIEGMLNSLEVLNELKFVPFWSHISNSKSDFTKKAENQFLSQM